MAKNNRRKRSRGVSRRAKRAAYTWDELPEQITAHWETQAAEILRMKKENPELYARLYPSLPTHSRKKTSGNTQA